MSNEHIEKILRNTRKSMEIEGFQISQELEDTGRKLLNGELSMDDYIASCKKKAQGYAHEIWIW